MEIVVGEAGVVVDLDFKQVEEAFGWRFLSKELSGR